MADGCRLCAAMLLLLLLLLGCYCWAATAAFYISVPSPLPDRADVNSRAFQVPILIWPGILENESACNLCGVLWSLFDSQYSTSIYIQHSRNLCLPASITAGTTPPPAHSEVGGAHAPRVFKLGAIGPCYVFA
ncbi:hypothetical protein GE21DRAFT_9116 [Neurospora crassa]|uniref:Uncharacterized protein n=1 Tax=Neurospora crassa (strain ATCC 24698 / 74-OR23-1A / CBS 708.71 / DSM 1257 / FGSC 987) TaxID=367110 RepID=Q7RZD2_NEUCR|nr:hypothetical protein NCU03895 [Neurospora crassa OR74A]EAA28298.1 hypothetical protein NCU03895 [Neurospora crassa OR74A]KHE78967.1 hypothetical protein GE21DRAFT_9116 [Neurospora crassa]|eukprot:XP_957534.1 hypothetical protein NCU03895 [Neurospora crassa OR74A]